MIGLPHERLGEEVCACLRVKTDLTQAEIRDFCKGRIAHFKIPAHVLVMEEFPQTQSGKIQKYKLVQIAAKIIREYDERAILRT